MSGAEAAGKAETQTNECARGGHVPGETAYSEEWGEMRMGADTIWESLSEGRTVTLLCRECGGRLTVRIVVHPTD